jgi:hypothetical protein
VVHGFFSELLVTPVKIVSLSGKPTGLKTGYLGGIKMLQKNLRDFSHNFCFGNYLNGHFCVLSSN